MIRKRAAGVLLALVFAAAMSVPQENSAPISTEPRVVVERTRTIPGTRRIASSSGRVTAGIICAEGSSAPSAITFTRGNVTVGKIEEGSRVADQTPAPQRTRMRRNSPAGRSETCFVRFMRRPSRLSNPI